MATLHVLILAAGEGKRMRSSTPKLLHPCAGIPLVAHVARAVCALDAASVHAVLPGTDDDLRAALEAYPVKFARQEVPTGTADAVEAGIAAIGVSEGRLLVVNGDCPGVRTSTLQHLIDACDDAAGAVLAVRPDDPTGYGRVRRDAGGVFNGIVEEVDADDCGEAGIEVNGGVYCFDIAALSDALPSIDANNTRGERYVTAVFGALAGRGAAITAVPYGDADEVHGVNSRAELARAEALLRHRTLARLMDAGVTVRDPSATWVDVDVEVGADTVLHPGVTLEGDTTIGEGCDILSHVRVSNSRLADGVHVLDGTVIEDSTVASGATLGPYARLRPGSEIGAGAKVGNFVETKATRMGQGSKAGHLSYLGNARIGDNVNIGAGTITCNYDGVAKHETIIEDGAFIGSNSALVAPVRIGRNAYVGAGSTITEDVPDEALGLGRGRQVNKEQWAARNDRS
ncbi:MAG: bifunctional UDP-N-acetylglucosamine diphosphorylase/glucosamine-1-phosphate N-acetyltransferase GlmU [Acidobacteriota bacterium]|jgi:bifunctional UDP-N-acetylglucosamine pyrophosphorylase/glucosamine-1-phosphate N-acetyltransferase